MLSADQHQNLIQRKYSSDAKFRLTGYWDLFRVNPLFKVPSCVLFAKRDPSPGSPQDKLPVLEWTGNLPGKDVAWNTAKTHLTHESMEGTVVYLGSRAAFSTSPGASTQSKPSKYQAAFRQGATIVPRSFYFVRITDFPEKLDPTGVYWAETDPEQALHAKKPYDDVHISGLVEGKFLYSTAIAKHVLPYAHLAPSTVVLPVGASNGSLSVLTPEKLIREGYREIGKWMTEAERLWVEKRGDKADRQTAFEWLDYQGKLVGQHLSQRHLVLYNAAGTNISAAGFDRHSCSLPFVVDHTLYWAAFSNETEAHYVVAILNAESTNLAIKPFQSRGLLGERHVHKKLLELPIPTFDHDNDTHRRVAELGAKASEEAATVLRSGEFPSSTSIARQRAFMRTSLESMMSEIEKLVRRLL